MVTNTCWVFILIAQRSHKHNSKVKSRNRILLRTANQCAIFGAIKLMKNKLYVTDMFLKRKPSAPYVIIMFLKNKLSPNIIRFLKNKLPPNIIRFLKKNS
ncbi:hypothetical protein BsWGS_20822 [Bradybaena similaris]